MTDTEQLLAKARRFVAETRGETESLKLLAEQLHDSIALTLRPTATIIPFPPRANRHLHSQGV